jgi:hypothetical protein
MSARSFGGATAAEAGAPLPDNLSLLLSTSDGLLALRLLDRSNLGRLGGCAKSPALELDLETWIDAVPEAVAAMQEIDAIYRRGQEVSEEGALLLHLGERMLAWVTHPASNLGLVALLESTANLALKVIELRDALLQAERG